MPHYTFQGKPLSPRSMNMYVNLDTGDIVDPSTAPKHLRFVKLGENPNGSPFIAGSSSTIRNFLDENDLELVLPEKSVRFGENIELSPYTAPPKISRPKGILKTSPSARGKSPSREKKVCSERLAGEVLYTPPSYRVQDIPKEVFEQMCPLRLIGLEGEGSVVRVINANTLELGVYLSFAQLSYRADDKKSALKRHPPTGFFTLLQCRLQGVDLTRMRAPEKQKILERIRSHAYVYYVIRGMDKYGYALVDLYADTEKQEYLNVQ